MFDIWDEQNQLIKETYKKDNYSVELINEGEARVIVYFSSLGIYTPDARESFIENIIKQDRYEWSNIKADKVKKSIFVRDIYQQWYVEGINERINSIEKVIEFIRDHIPTGFSLVTVGASAGGYMAEIVGAVLNAEYVINFSGQNNLYMIKGRNPLIEKHKSTSESFFYDMRRVFEKYGVPRTYYVYSSKCMEDRLQFEMISNYANIFPFAIKSKKHAKNLYGFAKKHFISLSKTELDDLYRRIKNKEVSEMVFTIRMMGLISTIKNITHKMIRMIIRKQ